mmetsp:Transcript_34634/g.69969  ORF Transcript_34634/g.69969 Transcript_34634/m.69969 type:complete len:218 (+) Transcript_34634:1271-1924(+)
MVWVSSLPRSSSVMPRFGQIRHSTLSPWTAAISLPWDIPIRSSPTRIRNGSRRRPSLFSSSKPSFASWSAFSFPRLPRSSPVPSSLSSSVSSPSGPLSGRLDITPLSSRTTPTFLPPSPRLSGTIPRLTCHHSVGIPSRRSISPVSPSLALASSNPSSRRTFSTIASATMALRAKLPSVKALPTSSPVSLVVWAVPVCFPNPSLPTRLMVSPAFPPS